MSKGTFVDFKRLKEQVGIRRVLEHYGLIGSLKEQGERLSGRCPLCEGESESLRVSQEKSCFKCFRCDAGGNVLDFVAAKEKCSVREAAVRIAGWFGIETGKPAKATRQKPAGPAAAKGEAPKLAPAGNEGNSDPRGQEPPVASDMTGRPKNVPLTFELKLDHDHPWFAENGILPETVREFGLGYCAKGMMAGRIAFPVRNQKRELLGYAGLWVEEHLPEGTGRWKYPSNLDLSTVAYPIDLFTGKNWETFRLALDPLEVVMAWQANVRNSIAFLSRELRMATLLDLSS